MANFIVIGGGIAGLTAANALADTGAKVTVLEKSHELGGRGRTRQEDNHFLNLGPHALYQGGVAAQTFREWKIPFSGGNPGEASPNLRPMLVREGKLYPAVKGLSTLVTSRLFNLWEKMEVARLFSSFIAADADPAESMADWLDRNIQSPAVRDYAKTLIRIATYSIDLQHLSARAALKQVSSALQHGVLYLDQGWQTIVNGLALRAHCLGVEIRCGEPVSSLDNLHADGIVLAVGPEAVESLTGIHLPARRAAHAASLDLCLSRVPEDAPTAAFDLDRPLYFSVHSAVAKLAPEGGATVHVAKYLDEGAHNPRVLLSELEAFADLVMPGWRQSLVHARFLPHLAATEGILTVAGRADVTIPGMDGVVIAGDWVGAEGMLVDAAVASALRAANTIQQSKAMAA